MSVTSPVTGRVTGIVTSGVTRAIGHRTRIDVVFDDDALTYIAAVEAADDEALESSIKVAYNNFIKGCKADGIWDAIKASCIMAGARTLAGCLTPLKGTAPTNVGPFVTGDYNRITGLAGGGAKHLDSNRAGNADPQNNRHVAAFLSQAGAKTASSLLICDAMNGIDVVTQLGINPGISRLATRVSNIAGTNFSLYSASGFYGASRNLFASYQVRGSSTTDVATQDSQTPLSFNLGVFSRTKVPVSEQMFDGRLSFYSIGESINLANLDTRVSALMTAIGEALA